MLNYDLDDVADRRSAPCDPQWASSWEGDTLPGSTSLLSFLFAAKDTARPTGASQPKAGRRAPTTFQPEFMSGFCAAG